MRSSIPPVLTQCPLCQAAYDAGMVEFVGRDGRGRVFHCRCAHCGQAILAVVIESPGSMASVGLVTDLEAQDAVRFHEFPPVDSNECIDWHNWLAKKSKDVCQALMTPVRIDPSVRERRG